MMESINAFFNRRKEPAPVTPPPSTPNQRPSEATTVVEETKDIDTEEKDIGANSLNSGQSFGRRLLSHRFPFFRRSTSSSPPPSEAETASSERRDPFAGGIEGGVTYQSMKWWHAALGMVAETVSLGILALAHTLPVLGLVPGIILLLSLGIMATYAGYVIGQFKLRYPHIHSMGDAGGILFGAFGREVFGIGAALFIVFIMGAHIIAGAKALNVLSDDAACSLVWAVVIAVTSFVFTLSRTLKMTTWLSAISFLSVIAAVVVVIVDLIQERPGFKVVEGKMPHKFTFWGDPNATFADAVGEVTTIMFAFAGTVAFFPFISELENPKDFPKALAFLQIWSITLYVVSAIVMYVFGGQLIESPALNSASPSMQKVAWGVALGTLIIAGVINAHVAAKYFYVRLLRNNKEDLMHQTTWKARGIWIFICAISWLTAWLLAMGVPAFEDMVMLTGALFASWFTFGLPGMFWCHMNLRFEKIGLFKVQITRRVPWNRRKRVLLGINIFYVFVGAFTMVAGLYASGIAIKEGVNERTKAFSCR